MPKTHTLSDFLFFLQSIFCWCADVTYYMQVPSVYVNLHLADWATLLCIINKNWISFRTSDITKTFFSATSLTVVDNPKDYNLSRLQEDESQGREQNQLLLRLFLPEGRQMICRDLWYWLHFAMLYLPAHPAQFKNISGNAIYFTCYTAVWLLNMVEPERREV